MKKTKGMKGIALVESTNQYIGKWRVRWDVKPVVNDGEEPSDDMVEFYETDMVLSHKPRLQELQEAIYGVINADTDEKILSGFEWRGMKVWLSSENQFNYKAAYDLAVMAEGKTLPVVFKFGTTYEPIYYEFTTLDELSDFYIRAMKYINDCLSEGWKMKDGIDWGEYEEALK